MARTRATDYQDKQRNILDTAAAVFAQFGMEKASMAEIARQGNFSKALLYHYYTSKDALIFDIIRTHLDDLDAALQAADRPDLSAPERLRLLIRQVVESYEDSDDKHKVQLNCMGTLSAEQSEQLRVIERRIVKRFSAVLGLINPDLDNGQPLLMPVTMSLFGILNWIYMWFRADGRLSRMDYADLVTTMMLDGVKAVRQASGEPPAFDEGLDRKRRARVRAVK